MTTYIIEGMDIEAIALFESSSPQPSNELADNLSSLIA